MPANRAKGFPGGPGSQGYFFRVSDYPHLSPPEGTLARSTVMGTGARVGFRRHGVIFSLSISLGLVAIQSGSLPSSKKGHSVGVSMGDALEAMEQR